MFVSYVTVNCYYNCLFTNNLFAKNFQLFLVCHKYLSIFYYRILAFQITTKTNRVYFVEKIRIVFQLETTTTPMTTTTLTTTTTLSSESSTPSGSAAKNPRGRTNRRNGRKFSASRKPSRSTPSSTTTSKCKKSFCSGHSYIFQILTAPVFLCQNCGFITPNLSFSQGEFELMTFGFRQIVY